LYRENEDFDFQRHIQDTQSDISNQSNEEEKKDQIRQKIS
jgi:hypothetical protein